MPSGPGFRRKVMMITGMRSKTAARICPSSDLGPTFCGPTTQGFWHT